VGEIKDGQPTDHSKRIKFSFSIRRSYFDLAYNICAFDMKAITHIKTSLLPVHFHNKVSQTVEAIK